MRVCVLHVLAKERGDRQRSCSRPTNSLKERRKEEKFAVQNWLNHGSETQCVSACANRPGPKRNRKRERERKRERGNRQTLVLHEMLEK